MTIGQAFVILLAEQEDRRSPEAGPSRREASADVVRQRMMCIVTKDRRVRSYSACEDVVQHALLRLLTTRNRCLRELAQSRVSAAQWLHLVDRAAFYGASNRSIASALGLAALPEPLLGAASAARDRAQDDKVAGCLIRMAVKGALVELHRRDIHIGPDAQVLQPIVAVDTLPRDGGNGFAVVADQSPAPDDRVDRLRVARLLADAVCWLEDPGLREFSRWQDARSAGAGARRVDQLILLRLLNERGVSLTDHIRATHRETPNKPMDKALQSGFQDCTRARKALIDFVSTRCVNPDERDLMRAVLHVIDERYRIHRRRK